MNKKEYSGSVWSSRLALLPRLTFVLEITGLCLVWFLVWRFMQFREHTAASSFIGNIADVTQFFGGIIVVIFCSRAPGFTAFIRTFVYGGTLIALLPVIIWGRSDTLSQASWDQPLLPVSVIMVCCGVVYAVCNMFVSDDPVGDVDVRKGFPASRTAKDRRIVAAHEAGHALMYAAWSPLPTTLQVSINSSTDNSGSLGYVRCGEPQPRLMDKNRETWEMLLALAGMAGEQHYTGDVSSGAFDDGRRWLSHAVPWLVCHLKTGIYYPDPSTHLELESNQHHLMVLKAEHNALLTEFFTLNHDLHARLTEALMPGETLEARHLHPYLAAVRLPDAFPRVASLS
ncbi:ATP-dependent metallopeptidase HflB [Salmonella enterica subsp. enterica serovar Bovismorbificans]|nr:ATP-dependent metallopeptidase HflB [Salmonella enterica subsp. enterica serovar Bovismorbificans]